MKIYGVELIVFTQLTGNKTHNIHCIQSLVAVL